MVFWLLTLRQVIFRQKWRELLLEGKCSFLGKQERNTELPGLSQNKLSALMIKTGWWSKQPYFGHGTWNKVSYRWIYNFMHGSVLRAWAGTLTDTTPWWLPAWTQRQKRGKNTYLSSLLPFYSALWGCSLTLVPWEDNEFNEKLQKKKHLGGSVVSVAVSPQLPGSSQETKQAGGKDEVESYFHWNPKYLSAQGYHLPRQKCPPVCVSGSPAVETMVDSAVIIKTFFNFFFLWKGNNCSNTTVPGLVKKAILPHCLPTAVGGLMFANCVLSIHLLT